MARVEHDTPYYIRTTDGECFNVETLGEAVAEFVGETGYRLTITTGDGDLVIRRSSFEPQLIVPEPKAKASVIWREKL